MKKVYISVIAFVLSVITVCMGVQISGVHADTEFKGVTAKSYVIVDDSGKILIGKDAHKKREVASICKLMTTLITLEKIELGDLSLEDKFMVSEYASDVEGSQAFLDSGKEYLVKDLLKSVIVASANDSAIVLAEGIGGNEKSFVKLMNEKAIKLGMINTRYSNSTGLPALEQYSTAYDTAILLDKVSEFDIYKDFAKIWIDELEHSSGRKTELVNTNRLVKYYDYCSSGKTGFTDEAGYCLSSVANKGNLELTCVVLGCNSSANRFKESIELYNYAFANYRNEQVVFKDNQIENDVKVIGGKIDNVQLKPQEDFYLTTRVGNDVEYEIAYQLPKEIKASIQTGDVVGEMYVIVNGEIIKTINVVSVIDIEKQNFSDILDKILNNFNVLK